MVPRTPLSSTGGRIRERIVGIRLVMLVHRAIGAVAKDKEEKWSGALDLNSETKISEKISE